MTKHMTAVEHFIAVKAEIDGLIERLSAQSADHFGVAPDDIHFGHVGDLNRMAALLREALGSDE